MKTGKGFSSDKDNDFVGRNGKGKRKSYCLTLNCNVNHLKNSHKKEMKHLDFNLNF